MTKIEFINKAFFQWFFIRLAKISDNGKPKGYLLLGFVLPLSGWSNDYIQLGKMWRLTLADYTLKKNT